MINDQHFSDLAVSRMSAGQIAGAAPAASTATRS
jgi:hypothetical protein